MGVTLSRAMSENLTDLLIHLTESITDYQAVEP